MSRFSFFLLKTEASQNKRGTISLDVPQEFRYPGSQSIKKNDEREEVTVSTLVTNDDVVAVSRWYTDALSTNGWDISIRPVDTEASDIQFMKAYKEDLVIDISVIRKDNGKTEIALERFSPALEVEVEEDSEPTE